MRADLATALNNASPTLRARLVGELREHMEFLDQNLPAGEQIIRLIGGIRKSLLVALTSRRLIFVAEALAVTSYTLTQVDTFLVRPPERSWLTNLVSPPAKDHWLYVKDHAGYNHVLVPAEDCAGLEEDFRSARGKALMASG